MGNSDTSEFKLIYLLLKRAEKQDHSGQVDLFHEEEEHGLGAVQYNYSLIRQE